MNRRWIIACIAITIPLWGSETVIVAPETGAEDRPETSLDQESESRGVIPQGGLTVSTQVVTPISIIPEKKQQEQAAEALALAQELWMKGKLEAASDVALQAYDEWMGISAPRRNKKRRQEIQRARREAATVYVNASIAYIQSYVRKRGDTPEAHAEGRARLRDLHDVAMNYSDLMKKLSTAVAAYSVGISTYTVLPSTTTR